MKRAAAYAVRSERAFYLREFRGRTLAAAARPAALRDPRPLRRVVQTLTRNGTRILLLAPERRVLRSCLDAPLLTYASAGHPGGVEVSLWEALRERGTAGLAVGGGDSFPARCREVAQRLRLSKLILIEPQGGLRDPRGRRLSFVHGAELKALLHRGGPRVSLLRDIERLLEAGTETVNLCTAEGLGRELLTYEGSGTLFTRQRYVEVHPLGIEDFDAAQSLLQSGTRRGLLLERSRAELQRVLGSGFGAFLEGRHLAGLGALLVDPGGDTGEIASLCAVSRFLGEGVGGELVGYALRRARSARLARVFACTISPQVGSFFEHQGFRPVAPETLPPGKWRSYDRQRRRHLRCYERRPV